MSANVEAMVREGINAYKGGRKDEARALLLKATELDQYNEEAWLWLSGVMDSPEDQRTCLENVLAINPNNDRAKKGLSYLSDGDGDAGSVASIPASFSASPPPAYGDPPSSSAPTSVEWGAPPEPAATMPAAWAQPAPRGEPTPEALDDWVTNLNLPTSETSAFSFTAGSTSAASPFGDFDLSEEDVFADGPFGSPSAASFDDPITTPEPTRSPRQATPPRDEPPPRRRRTSPARSENASLLYDLDSEKDSVRVGGEEGMFGYIPPEIAPTRLPGTRERIPALLMVSTIILILLNLGAALLLMLGLLT